MGRAQRTAFSWNLLQEELGGSFTARAPNLLSTEFVLLRPDGREFGLLRLRGPSVAEFESGDYTAALKRSGRSYLMVAGGEQVLAAVPKGRSIDELELSCDSQTYKAKASFFRNLAVASRPGAARVVCLSGGLTGRNYEALFATENGCALRVAVFLLWHLATNRRRAYRMGARWGEERYRVLFERSCTKVNNRVLLNSNEQKEQPCNRTRTTAGPREKESPAPRSAAP